MKVTFLGQGFTQSTDGSVGQQLINLFGGDEYKKFTGVAAFASEAGINGLASCILSSNGFDSFNLIVGIDQEGTSKEALEEILKLNINAYIFYQKEQSIFHPKIYLFEGSEKTALIVGSSNLTGRGLFNNVETSLLVEFDNDDAQGLELLRELKDYYKSLFDFSDPNLFKISPDVIQNFVDSGVLPLKKTWLKRQGKKEAKGSGSKGIVIPSRPTAKLPDSFRGKPKARELSETFLEESEAVDEVQYDGLVAESVVDTVYETTSDVTAPTPIPVPPPPPVPLREVWRSKPLSERDLNIPTGTNTNATGSMLLKKGLKQGMDFRHYFRDVVFARLNWQPHPNASYSHLEKATATFRFKIDGADLGRHQLVINHNKATDTTAYKQKNAMTNLSWGGAKPLIAKRSLLGKTMRLYEDNEPSSDFLIEID